MSNLKRAFSYIALIPALVWIAIISYLFYLGLSTGDWLSDEFFHWEFISLGWAMAVLVCAPWAMGNLTTYGWRKEKRG